MLIKGKKGSYPNARRQVPAQPIRFSQNMYNTRKLSEFPFHLTLSGQFQPLMTEVFCNPEWLYAKCHTMSLTALMEDLRSAEQKCADFVVELKQQAEIKVNYFFNYIACQIIIQPKIGYVYRLNAVFHSI